MTYGWAILIIAVVLAALFELGVFNPMTFAPKASPGSCQVIRPEGAGTNNFISLQGTCNNEIPEYVALLNGNSYISANTIDLPIGSASRTIIAWFSPSSLNSSYGQTLISYGTTSCTGYYTQVYIAGNCGGPYVGINAWCTNECIDTSLSTNTWYFIAYAYNGINQFEYLGINGKIISVNETATYQTTSTPFNIGLSSGSGQTAGGLDFTGHVADIQLYNTALSANDVQALYQEGIGGAPINIQSLVGWWPLNGNANDYSGNGNNGVPSSVIYTTNWYSGYNAP